METKAAGEGQLTLGDYAKYPFIREASEYLRETQLLRLEDLSNPNLKPVVRAAARIRLSAQPLKDVTAPEIPQGEEENELLSFPLALALARATGDSYLWRRLALYEARVARARLEAEPPWKIVKLAAENFGWETMPAVLAGLDVDDRDASIPAGADFVLHLHGLEHQDHVLGFDLLAFLHEQLHHHAGHVGRQASCAHRGGPFRRRSLGRGDRRGGAGRYRLGDGSGRRRCLGGPCLDTHRHLFTIHHHGGFAFTARRSFSRDDRGETYCHFQMFKLGLGTSGNDVCQLRHGVGDVGIELRRPLVEHCLSSIQRDLPRQAQHNGPLGFS